MSNAINQFELTLISNISFQMTVFHKEVMSLVLDILPRCHGGILFVFTPELVR
jgi:hypothetical protein